jgi:hypothetical protein
MTQPLIRAGKSPAMPAKPQLTAAQQALLERRVLPMSSLEHGACYSGLLDNQTMVGRWHAEKHRFIFWEQNPQQPQAKSTPHVADLGIGPRFAPLSRQQPDAGSPVSDFAFATAR